MDMGAIGAAVTSLRFAGDIAKGLLNLHTMAEVQAKAIELNEKIIAAQHQIYEANSAQAALIERVRELEGQIAAMKNWDAEKKRYKLVSPQPGAFVYAIEKSMCEGEPPHYLCANCFKQGKASIVNDVPVRAGWHGWACPNCKAAPLTGLMGPSQTRYAETFGEPA